MAFLRDLLDRAFDGAHQLSTDEDELLDMVRDVAQCAQVLCSDPAERLTLFSATCARVRELHLVEHPEALVKLVWDREALFFSPDGPRQMAESAFP